MDEHNGDYHCHIPGNQELTSWQVDDYRRTDSNPEQDQNPVHEVKGEQLKSKMDSAQCAYAKQIELVRVLSEQ